jgi:hypothetical protein
MERQHILLYILTISGRIVEPPVPLKRCEACSYWSNIEVILQYLFLTCIYLQSATQTGTVLEAVNS